MKVELTRNEPLEGWLHESGADANAVRFLGWTGLVQALMTLVQQAAFFDEESEQNLFHPVDVEPTPAP